STSLLSSFSSTDTATTATYTLSLHDALPISQLGRIQPVDHRHDIGVLVQQRAPDFGIKQAETHRHLADHRVGFMHQSPLVIDQRSEEHTSELQSRENLVCRLLLEKKKNKSED